MQTALWVDRNINLRFIWGNVKGEGVKFPQWNRPNKSASHVAAKLVWQARIYSGKASQINMWAT
jgi:hypothetical protein